MINCPNCGGLNGNGNPTCSFCGASLMNSTTVDPNLVSIQSPNSFTEPVYDNQNMGDFAEQPVYEQNVAQDDFYAPAADMSNDGMLVDAYIQKNVDKIKNGGFSIWAFFFGGIYIWYRKLYKLLLIWIGISMLSSALFSILKIWYASLAVSLIFNIFVGIKFKELYIKNVNVKVATIKSNNAEESPENLALICSKKGGTTILPIIIFGLLLVTVIALVIVPFISKPNGDNDLNSKKENMTEVANSMVESVRNYMIANEINDNSKVYDMDEVNNLLETPLTISPFGKNYVYAKVQAIKTMDGTYMYKVCLIDEDKNGFGYTSEMSLSANSVLLGTAPDNC